MDWVNAVVQGTLLGGLYALFAAGLSLIFGVMRLVNIAHGDLIVLSAYLGLTVIMATGMHPLLALMIVMPTMAAIGYVLQRGILNQTLGDDLLPTLLVTLRTPWMLTSMPCFWRRYAHQHSCRQPVQTHR